MQICTCVNLGLNGWCDVWILTTIDVKNVFSKHEASWLIEKGILLIDDRGLLHTWCPMRTSIPRRRGRDPKLHHNQSMRLLGLSNQMVRYFLRSSERFSHTVDEIITYESGCGYQVGVERHHPRIPMVVLTWFSQSSCVVVQNVKYIGQVGKSNLDTSH